jgi:ATP-dependent helicase/DNAse subunit B
VAAKATVLLGRATAGKTTKLIRRYGDRLADRSAIGRSLWIAPTHRAVEAVREWLIDAGLAACLAPNCLTFSQFAEAVIAASRLPIRPLDQLEKRQLIRRLIDQGVAEGWLVYFRAIAHTEGLLDLVSELFADLKRQEIWPEELTATCRRLGNQPKDRELAELYDRYQTLLLRQNLYDDEGRFWAARDLIGQGQLTPFHDLRLVIVDGFADFTRTQHEILTLLHARTDELLISLPWDASRNDLFDKPNRTLAELGRRLPGFARQEIARHASAAEQSPAATLAHLESNLFRDPRSIQASDAAVGLEIVAAAGEFNEIELIARRIKRLLLEGDDGATVAPGDIVVVFRSVSSHAFHIREVFGEYGIPFAIDHRIACERAPLMSALIETLKLDLDDWPFRSVLQVCLSNYFRPGWPAWRNGEAGRAVERAVRKLQIPNGRQALLAALKRWADREPSVGDSAERRRRQEEAHAAHAVLDGVAAAFDRLPTSATAVEWSAALNSLAADLGMLAVAQAECELPVARHDLKAWELFQARLQASSDLEVRLVGAAGRLDRRALVERVELIAATDELPREHDDVGRVRVLDAAGVRALEVPYLFVAGLAEKSFPPAARDDRLYSATDHRRLNEAGLRFVEQHERACEEMLLFYEVITRARQRLCLSYSAMDEKAQPLSPSPYLLEVERLFQATAIDRGEAPNLSPVPRGTELYCHRDLRIKAIDMAIGGSTRLAGRLIARPDGRELATSLLAALRVATERSRHEAFGPFEGMLTSAAARAEMAKRFGPHHCWSTSQLELYGNCPHKFFLQHVLHLGDVEDLSLEIDTFRRGRRLHSTLAELHWRLNTADGPRAPTDCEAEELRGWIVEALSAVMQRSASDGPLQAALDAVDLRLLERWMERYLRQHGEYERSFARHDQPPKPAYFEVSFGSTRDDGEPIDPASQADEYVLDCNGMRIRLSGRIDRIDVGVVQGQMVFNVLDYKTGSSRNHKLKDIAELKSLQLPLYALVVQELILPDRNAVPWQAGYWHVRDDGITARQCLMFSEQTPEGIRSSAAWAELRERLRERVGRLVSGVRQGEFPMHCEDEDCTGRCPYKTVCRVHAVRSLEKTWEPPPINSK